MRAHGYWFAMVAICGVRLAFYPSDPEEARTIVWVAMLFFGGFAAEGLAHDTKAGTR